MPSGHAAIDYSQAGRTCPWAIRDYEPGSCLVGDVYFNSVTGKLRICATANIWSDAGAEMGALAASALTGTVPVANGGTGTSLTLAGIVRGSASAMTAAELSGDISTNGSNVTTLRTDVGKWSKYTVAYSNDAFKSAATGVSVTLAALPAHVAVEAVRIKNSAAFSGTSVTAATVSLGDGSNHTAYAAAADVFISPSATAQQWTGGPTSTTDSGHNLVARFTADVNFGSGTTTVLTAGSVDIWVKTSILP